MLYRPYQKEKHAPECKFEVFSMNKQFKQDLGNQMENTS